MQKNQKSRSNFQLAFIPCCGNAKKTFTFTICQIISEPKVVVPHLHHQQLFLKSVQSVKCKLFAMFNLACQHFDLYFPHSLQSNSLQQHTKMFSKIMFIIRRLYFSTAIVRKCWCRRDFISDRLKSRSEHEGFVKGFVLNAKRI